MRAARSLRNLTAGAGAHSTASRCTPRGGSPWGWPCSAIERRGSCAGSPWGWPCSAIERHGPRAGSPLGLAVQCDRAARSPCRLTLGAGRAVRSSGEVPVQAHPWGWSCSAIDRHGPRAGSPLASTLAALPVAAHIGVMANGRPRRSTRPLCTLTKRPGSTHRASPRALTLRAWAPRVVSPTSPLDLTKPPACTHPNALRPAWILARAHASMVVMGSKVFFQSTLKSPTFEPGRPRRKSAKQPQQPRARTACGACPRAISPSHTAAGRSSSL